MDVDKKDGDIMVEILEDVLSMEVTSYAKLLYRLAYLRKSTLMRLRIGYPQFDWVLRMMLQRNKRFARKGN